jgi:hypothetical protein
MIISVEAEEIDGKAAIRSCSRLNSKLLFVGADRSPNEISVDAVAAWMLGM